MSKATSSPMESQLEIAWTYADAEYLRGSWFAKRVFDELPQWACYRSYRESADRSMSALRFFLDSPQNNVLLSSILENHASASAMEIFSQLYGGVSVIFDLNLSSMFISRFRHSTGGRDIDELFMSKYKNESPKVGDDFVKAWSIEPFLNAFPLESEAFARLGLVFVFTKEQERRALTFFPKESICRLSLPLLMRSKESIEAERSMLRQIFGFGSTDIVVGLTDGGVGAEILFSAMGRATLSHVRCLWLLNEGIGDRRVEALLMRYELRDRVKTVRVQREQEWESFHSLFDIGCYFSQDQLQGPSLSALVALEHGVPIMTMKLGFGGDLGPSISIVLEGDRYFEESVLRHLVELERNANYVCALRNETEHFVKSNHPRETAKTFVSAVEARKGTLLNNLHDTENAIAVIREGRLDDCVCREALFQAFSARERDEFRRSLGWDLAKNEKVHGL